MAAVATPAEQAKDLLQNLSLDPKKKTHDSTEPTKKSAASGGEAPNIPIPSDRSVTPLLQDFVDQSMWYPSMSYYYGGYDGAMSEWDDYSRYVNHDGVEMPSPGVYGDMYHHGYGYAPYGPYPSPGSPVPSIGHDGQLYGTHQYQYPTAYYQQPAHANAQNATPQKPSSRVEVSTSAASEQTPLSVDAAKASSNGVANGSINKNNSPAQKLSHNHSAANCAYNKIAFSSGLSSPAYADMRYNLDARQSPVPWVDGPGFTDGLHRSGTNRTPSAGLYASSNRSQNVRPVPHVMGLSAQRPSSAMGPVPPGYLNRMYPNGRMYGQYGNSLRNGFALNGFDSRLNRRWGVGVDGKYKPRGRGNGFYDYGNENLDGLSELTRGPRSDRFKNQKGIVASVTSTAKCEDLVANDKTKSDNTVIQDKDSYNVADFPVQYSDARFFIIKSYSEDDVHKSVKYGVWASTPNGNKKLDGSYQEAQGKEGGCPVFLFFSVNTSGQFVGVAEMVGPVDFKKTVEYWQQDKWNGCFPVKWHIVKDVPNSILKHIILENNDNKPVTNSRDTQEVKLEQGLQMLKIFKDHASKTSILDDFGFYEMRQKVMQEKKAKQQQFQKQIPNGKVSDPSNVKDDNVLTPKSKLQSPLEVVSLLKKDVQGSPAERKSTEENCVAAVTDVPKVAELPPNGVANGC